MSATVTFTAPSTGLFVTVLLDAPSPVLTDGFGGWETIDRPKRTGLTRFKGRNPFKQDLAVLFDGWIGGVSQEYEITKLMTMAHSDDLQEPPQVKLTGVALRKDKSWIIDSIDFDTTNVIWDMIGGVPIRLRQAAVVHLIEYVSDEIITTPAQPNITVKKVRIKVTAQGLTGKQIAQLYLGSPDKWWQILDANPKLKPTYSDSRKVVPEGTHISIPSGSVAPPKSIVVP